MKISKSSKKYFNWYESVWIFKGKCQIKSNKVLIWEINQEQNCK